VSDDWGGYLIRERTLDDGRVAIVYRITFGRARIAIAPFRGSLVLDDEW